MRAFSAITFKPSLKIDIFAPAFFRYFAARKDFTDACNARNCTPTRTPLPHEVPGREVRRASDPCRAQDPNFESLRRLQRFHSLNMVKPLPIPPSMRSLQNKASSNQTFHSSRSSIATDYSLPENCNSEHGSPEYSFPGDLDTEAALDERMLEDNEDMIIPDDMQRFLNERYHNNQPLSDDMQRFLSDRYSSNVSSINGSDNHQQPSQMSFVDSGGLDSLCTSRMSHDGSNSVGSYLQDHSQLSPHMPSQSMHHMRGHGQFSPNLHVQTGFDSNISSPLPSLSSPYGSQGGSSGAPMPMSPWPQTQQSSMVNHHCQAQQHPMPPPPVQNHQHQHNNHNHNHMTARNVQLMSQGGHCPNNLVNGSAGCGMANLSGMGNGQNCVGIGMHGGEGMNSMKSGAIGHVGMPGMQNPGAAGPWQVPMPGTSGNSSFSQYHHHKQQLQQQQMSQSAMMGGELPGGAYTPVPPPMNKNMLVAGVPGMVEMSKPHRTSPQVQVPHISQSQIPPNAKRNMLRQQQSQSQQGMMSHQMQPQRQMSLPPLHHPVQPTAQLQAPAMHQHHHQQHIQPQQQSVYFDSHAGCQSQAMKGPLQQNYLNNGGGQMQNSVMDNMGTSNNAYNQRYHHPHTSSTSHHHRGAMISPSGTSTPSGMFCQPHPPSNQHPGYNSHLSPHPPYSYPMEMSPGCNQVTSSTDCKETTAPPIEDFMDNITSLSTENLIENISTDNVFGSMTGLPNRSASQNSNRYNPILNTSNMAVNDMSSMLTQLAEENKYLSMRP